jgi:hypothetical protein
MRWLAACVLVAVTACGAAAASAAPQASAEGGRWQVAAEGPMVVVYEHGLRVKALAAAGRDGRDSSAVAAIRYLPARRSFVISFETLPELWELSIDPQAAPIFDGLVHDYRMAEAVADPGYLGARRTRLDAPLRELAVDDSGAYVVGRTAAAPAGLATLHLVQLDVRRIIGRFTVGGDPDLAATQTLQRGSDKLLRIPDRKGGVSTFVDLRRARLLEQDAVAKPVP